MSSPPTDPDQPGAVPLTPAPAGPARAPSVAVLAWRQWRRDVRAGELRLLMLAVTLAVAALTAVGFFAERLNAGLARDARALLGGDAVVASDQPLPADFAAEARSRGLQVAYTTQFPSMARAGDAQGGDARLASIKAVSGSYPLRGRLTVGPPAAALPAGAVPADKGEPVAGGPAVGTVWVDGGLLGVLGLREGDALLLGERSFVVDRRIFIEPDRGAGFSSFAPRVMLHEDDLAATGLVQPASRVNHRLAVAAANDRGGDAAVAAYVRWAEERIEGAKLRGVRVDSLEGGRPEMRRTLDRARLFLNLVALLAALLAAVAVAIAARDFAQRHLDDCAMLRVLGQPQRRIAGIYLLEFGFAGLAASAAGVALGLALHGVFVWLLKGLLQVELPPPGAWPAAFGLGVGLTLLMGFGAPPVLQLSQVPPLRVIRREVGELKPASAGVLAAGVLGFAALLLAVAADVKLGLIAVGGFAAALAVFGLAAWLAVRALRRLVGDAGAAPRWLVLATRQIAARPAFAVVQVSALAVGLLALCLLVLLRTDLIASWRAATPPDAPNRFVINVLPEQSQAFRAALARAGVTGYDWYPMIRGRLVAVNGADVRPDSAGNDRARRSLDRELNLSHAAAMPAHNERAAGTWDGAQADGLSVEVGIAESLGLKLGDRLRFDIGGQAVEGRVTHLRKVDWGSMRVNFFMMFTRAEMPELPTTYIAALRAPEAAAGRPGAFDAALAREFPNITSVDVSAQIAQVQRVLDQVIRAVEFLFVFTLATGLTVLFAAIAATRAAREREFALMRAMGAGSRLLGQVQRAELLGVGALAGTLAAVAAVAIGWALAHFAFEFTWNPSPWVPLAGALLGALLALAAGWWGLRGVLLRPVVETLRRSTDG